MSNDTTPNDDDGQWHDVAELSQLDPAFPLGVEIDGTQVGIYQDGDRIHALEDICPHAFALMSQGFQEDGIIECPLHGARFEIATGKHLNEIGQRDLKCHAVRVENGRVCVKLAR
ncbi:MAG: non-heme iron oxygenase ferredoxin subunit [Burkholderiales bacterium]|nr:non-heme iron oxygenase ferredoxin subunit [Burkholderiales bacterium]